MTSGSRCPAVPRARHGLVLAGVCLALVLTACIPQNHSESSEVDDGSDSARIGATPPEFPTAGEIPAPLLVEGLVYDFTDRPRDQDYWSPPSAQAECAAQGIVDGIGASRLSQLGYRVATPGASLNDIPLSETERAIVIDQFSSCVDMQEGVASMLYGDGRMSPKTATCVAKGLATQQMLGPFVEAFAFGRAVDPFESDGAFATALLSQSNVCIPESAFDWPDVRLPQSDPLIDSDAPAGSSASAHPDDRPTGPTTTVSGPGATAAPTTSAPAAGQ